MKSLEQVSVGPGTELKRLIRLLLFIKPTETCGCDLWAMMMDEEGPDWCLAHAEEIVNHMEKEAQERGLPHPRAALYSLLYTAVATSKVKIGIKALCGR